MGLFGDLFDFNHDGKMDAFEKAAEQQPERCFVIGGGQIYAQALELADRLIVTHVHTIIEDADTFFPEFDKNDYEKRIIKKGVDSVCLPCYY